ncbi:DUF6434 domain-containing protein [Candidatus Enterococcus ferrettii]|uniref:DUF6434 domain-containing protein n=1 Tax=Candidatus Enterococcus ferrettii TaxID=2815324 RepID=A0ABV0ETP0_9ENTE|nr:DUF6434 domain-containing protein [Enterococcus sp. 665A]MBO1342453.1 hypothetical protein [Enterococcus sp. 665A]
MERPTLSSQLSTEQFRQYYYLKEELISFCQQEQLQATGNKQELNDRIAHYLTTGQKQTIHRKRKKSLRTNTITLEEPIEEDFVCSEIHRAFFKEHLGQQFSFNVAFQKWLKESAGKTYQEALNAYQEILLLKKKQPTIIGQQFEYNTYIRAFFADNPGSKLPEAIACWKYKKSLPGSNSYQPQDLEALKERRE